MSSFFALPYAWLLLALLVWYSGIGGSNVYHYPAYCFVALMLWRILAGPTRAPASAKARLLEFLSSERAVRLLWSAYVIHGLVLFSTAYARFYSFGWHVADLGIYSNILDNIVQDHRMFSSYLHVHALADHLTPTGLFIFTPLYMIAPTAHWLTLTKVFCFVVTPLLLHRVTRELGAEGERSALIAVAAGAYGWVFYAPSLNALNFEFHVSSLAAPLIVYAYLCKLRQHWIRFSIVLFLMLGLKEHLGVVWMGFGLHFIVLGKSRGLGVVLVSVGAFAVIVSTLVIVPSFNVGQISATTEFHLPWNDLPNKVLYVFWLLAPLLFVPLLGWRHGIIAAPAIAVNLIGKPNMYTSQFHYDDLVSPLLLLASVIAISQGSVRHIYESFRGRWRAPILALFSGVVLLAQLPVSPIRDLRHAWPSREDREAYREVSRFGAEHPEASISVGNSFGYMLHNSEAHVLAKCTGPHADDFILLMPERDSAPLLNVQGCLALLAASPDLERVEGFAHAVVYRNTRSSE